MEKTSLVNNIRHVDACLRVESNALVFIMGPAVKNIVGMIFPMGRLVHKIFSPYV